MARKTWVEHLPPQIQPYLYLMRIDKPIGTLLLFYPCGQPFFFHTSFKVGLTFDLAWSITMASYATQSPLTTPLIFIGIFGLGALVMRGAGCTINDMWDRNLDKAVGMYVFVMSFFSSFNNPNLFLLILFKHERRNDL